MAYKNERDRICHQQNSCERERHHGEMLDGEMLGLSGIVLAPEPCGSSSDYHDPNRWHNHLPLPLMPAPFLLLGAMLICLGALITWRTPVNRWAWDSIRQIAGHFVVELLNQVALYAVLIGIVLLLYGLFGV